MREQAQSHTADADALQDAVRRAQAAEAEAGDAARRVVDMENEMRATEGRVRDAEARAQGLADDADRWSARCRVLEADLETQRAENERLVLQCREESTAREEAQALVAAAEQAQLDAQERENEWRAVAEQEKRMAQQMQATLEEMYVGQEQDAQSDLARELQDRVDAAEAEAERYELQVHDLEARLEEAGDAIQRRAALEQEVKEKELLIGKLRHEAVILNEHLTAAMAQLRRSASEDQVDRYVGSLTQAAGHESAFAVHRGAASGYQALRDPAPDGLDAAVDGCRACARGAAATEGAGVGLRTAGPGWPCVAALAQNVAGQRRVLRAGRVGVESIRRVSTVGD